MTEAEIIEGLTESTANVLSVVSIYFAIVSAYITAVYYFLNRAPFVMRAVAFAMLSGAFAFLGIAILGIERLLAGLIEAYAMIPYPIAEPPRGFLSFVLERGLGEHYGLAVFFGYALAGVIYAALAYLTFVHRWPQRYDRDLY